MDVSEEAGSPQVNSVTVSGGGFGVGNRDGFDVILGGSTSQMILADFGGDYDYADGIDDKQRIDGQTPPLQIVLTNTSTTQTVTLPASRRTIPRTRWE